MRVLAVFFTVLTISLTSAVYAGDRVIARVGSEAITQRELAAALMQNPDLTREKALDLLMERRLVLNWAANRNIKVSDREVIEAENTIRRQNNLSEEAFKNALGSSGETIELFRAGIREQITINKALGMALSAQVQVSESELQDLYEKTYPPETVITVSHILFTVDEDASSVDETSLQEKAAQVLSEIRSGTSFEDAAKRYSDDPSSSDKGGLLGTFGEGELLPELDRLAATLEPGETGGPVRTSAGYHILKLISREISEPPSFIEVQSELRRELLAGKEQTARKEWLDTLKETTYTEVFPDDG